jgi:hypothetical protein
VPVGDILIQDTTAIVASPIATAGFRKKRLGII